LTTFWGLIRRAIKGTYVSIEFFDLLRYLDEHVVPLQRTRNE